MLLSCKSIAHVSNEVVRPMNVGLIISLASSSGHVQQRHTHIRQTFFRRAGFSSVAAVKKLKKSIITPFDVLVFDQFVVSKSGCFYSRPGASVYSKAQQRLVFLSKDALELTWKEYLKTILKL